MLVALQPTSNQRNIVPVSFWLQVLHNGTQIYNICYHGCIAICMVLSKISFILENVEYAEMRHGDVILTLQ